MSGPWLCLECSMPLSRAKTCDQGDGCLLCSCGIQYAAAFVLGADRGIWERVRLERPFVRDGRELIVTVPAHWYDRESQ